MAYNSSLTAVHKIESIKPNKMNPIDQLYDLAQTNDDALIELINLISPL